MYVRCLKSSQQRHFYLSATVNLRSKICRNRFLYKGKLQHLTTNEFLTCAEH